MRNACRTESSRGMRAMPAAAAAVALFAALMAVGCNHEPGVSNDAGRDGTEAQPADENPGGSLRFINGYHAGVDEALTRKKPMLLFFTARWCRYCQQMAEEAFAQDHISDLSRQFVCVSVDADDEPGVCQEFLVTAFPTVLFISPGGVPLNRVSGKQPARQLAAEMHAALGAVARLEGGESRRF